MLNKMLALIIITVISFITIYCKCCNSYKNSAEECVSRTGKGFTGKVCLERALKDKLFGRKKGFPGRKQAFTELSTGIIYRGMKRQAVSPNK